LLFVFISTPSPFRRVRSRWWGRTNLANLLNNTNFIINFLNHYSGMVNDFGFVKEGRYFRVTKLLLIMEEKEKQNYTERLKMIQKKLSALDGIKSNEEIKHQKSFYTDHVLKNYLEIRNKQDQKTIEENFKRKIDLEDDILQLKKQLHAERAKIAKVTGDKDKFEGLYKEIEEKQSSSHIINRIHPDSVDKFLKSSDFKSKFEHGKETFAIVVSIDIRRSTDLMLKAKSPTDYSDFITELSKKLSGVIIDNLGIFDKFTGDGILAFFPEFYSGEDAILRALVSAELCHYIFKEHYTANRNKFTVHIKDVGLGIGIDCGIVSVANTPSELTVVGRPVVYACRFSGANAGETLLNLEAYEKLQSLDHPMVKHIEETEINIKNEGLATAFKIHIDSSRYKNDEYPWENFKNDYELAEGKKSESKSNK